MTYDDSLTADDIFVCQQCGDCCQGYGGTYVTEADIERIAAHIGETPESFLANFCDDSAGKPVLTQNDSGKCVFFGENCTIHPVKPRMCRAWPFIANVLREPGTWETMAGACPGIRTGIPEEILKRIVGEELAKLKAARGE